MNNDEKKRANNEKIDRIEIRMILNKDFSLLTFNLILQIMYQLNLTIFKQ